MWIRVIFTFTMEPFHIPKFDGTSTKLDFESYKTKLMAIGALRNGFQKAYKTDLPINLPETTLDPALTANEKLRATAMSYLILSTDGAPQNMIKQAGKTLIRLGSFLLPGTSPALWMHMGDFKMT